MGWLFLIIPLLLTAGSGQFLADAYLPAIPDIVRELGTTDAIIQGTMTTFLVGFAISQMVFGPLSDVMGRYRPMMFGLLLAFGGTALCYFAPTAEALLLGRFIQGAGIGGGEPIARALLRDVVPSDKLLRYNSYFSFFIVFFLAMSPVLGGYINELAGWRTIFLMSMVLVAVLMLLLKLQIEHRQTQVVSENRWDFIKANSKMVLGSRAYWGFVLPTCACYGSLFAFATFAPVYFDQVLSLGTTEIGWTFGAGMGIFMLTALVNGQLVTRVRRPYFILVYALTLLACSGGIYLYIAWAEYTSYWWTFAGCSLCYCASSHVFPISAWYSVDLFKQARGFASSAYGGLRSAIAVVTSGLIAISPDDTTWPIGLFTLFASLIALIGLCAWAIPFDKAREQAEASSS